MMKNVIDFLNRLSENNNRDWFNEHKAEYLSAQATFNEFVGRVIALVSSFDSEIIGVEPKNAVFRIYRDVRFSADKSPYKTNFAAAISGAGRSVSAPVYYFHVKPNENIVAGGIYRPDSSQLLKIRSAIVNDPERFLKIIDDKKIKREFGGLSGDKLKTAPKGFSRDEPLIEYLRFKQFAMFKDGISDEIAESIDYDKTLAKSFKLLKPFIDFIREAIA